jgi:hypothetical protein
MNKIRRLMPIILIFNIFTYADVPPETGKNRVGINLITETNEDFADFRFFLDFYGDLREVEIKSRGRSEIAPMGGGARYASGALLAIPKTNLRDFEGDLSTDRIEVLSRAIKNKKIEGVVELIKHRFSMDVPKGKKPPEVFYELKRSAEGITAERVTKPSKSVDSTASNSRISYVVGGILISLAIMLAGIFAFRKAAKKV